VKPDDRKSRICVVGSANVDLTFRTRRLPQAGETLAGQEFHLGMGGKGANQAVAAARLGACVSFVARVGNDAFGQEALRRYQTDGIDTSSVMVDPEAPTGVAAIMVDDQAENTIVVVAGANGKLSPADVRVAASAIKSADALLCQLETPIDATLEAFRLARSAGVRTVLTPAPAAELPTELLQVCDICVPNQTELQRLTGRTIETLDSIEAGAQQIRDRGIGIVVVTLGKRGHLSCMKPAHSMFLRLTSMRSIQPERATRSRRRWPSISPKDTRFTMLLGGQVPWLP